MVADVDYRQIVKDILLDPSLTLARYTILRLFISIRCKVISMYLGCLFYLFVYVELFRTHLKKSDLHLFPCTINCQTQVLARR